MITFLLFLIGYIFGYLVGRTHALLVDDVKDNCPKCPKCGEYRLIGNFCKTCGHKYKDEEPRLVQEKDTKKFLEYLHAHQRWNEPSGYVFSTTKMFLPYAPKERVIFYVDDVKYEWKSYKSWGGESRHSLEWIHPAYGKCKLINCVEDNTHIFNGKKFTNGNIDHMVDYISGRPHAVYKAISDEDRKLVKIGLLAVYTYMKYCEEKLVSEAIQAEIMKPNAFAEIVDKE